MKDNCSTCFKIKCRGCGWEPDSAQVILIQKEILVACPDCGWKPGELA